MCPQPSHRSKLFLYTIEPTTETFAARFYSILELLYVHNYTHRPLMEILQCPYIYIYIFYDVHVSSKHRTTMSVNLCSKQSQLDGYQDVLISKHFTTPFIPLMITLTKRPLYLLYISSFRPILSINRLPRYSEF